MKEYISALFILSVIIISCIFSTHFVAKTCDVLRHDISDCLEYAKNDDWANAERAVSHAVKYYSQRLPSLKMIIDHDSLNAGFDLLKKVEAAMWIRNDELCLSEGNALLQFLDNLADFDSFTLANVL